jgi:glycosyltransferase involved in cell wall biosynthesis
VADLDVIVTICTWNRCGLLRQTLEAMTRLRRPEGMSWELLVVDNNSTDETESTIDAFRTRLPLRSVFESTPGLSNARNRALRECAAADYVLFTDDDVLMSPDWLAAFAAGATGFPEAAALGGPIEPWWSVEPDPVLTAVFPALARGFCGVDHDRPLGPLDDEQFIWGANMAFRMSAIAGMSFDPSLGTTPSGRIAGGEELQFLRALRRRGGSVLWVPDMRVKHYVPPERIRLDYLLRFSTAKGREKIAVDGVPPGPRVFGVPRWLMRQWLEAHVRSLNGKLTRDRLMELRGARDASVFWGMASGCRELRHRQVSDPDSL